MSDDAYTLKQKKETEELHLFKGKFTEEGKCTSGTTSICRKMTKDESKANKFSCLTEKEARKECAAIGRKVCGICVSHLYATY